jgi:methylated-DNA-protein-cysteine methyltransferase-like protein
MRRSTAREAARRLLRAPKSATRDAAMRKAIRQIPRGKVATYGQIAELLGAPRAARIVGWAMYGNPHGRRVPCHRVVQQGGSLSPNYCIGDPGRQRRLLTREGVSFCLDGRIEMARHQWVPVPPGLPPQARRR